MFLLKSAILLFAAQMLLQGMSQAIRAGIALSRPTGTIQAAS